MIMSDGATIIAGLLSTAGLYYVQLLDYFGEDRAYTSWTGSLMNSFFMLAGKYKILR